MNETAESRLTRARAAAEPVPPKLGKYEVRRLIGRGGMGAVYLGHDPFADRDVAIKVNTSGPEDDLSPDFHRRMFFNEAHTAGLLQHPNILAVYDAGLEGAHPYIVMEHVDKARTLRELCRVEHLPPVKTAVEIVFKCARALDYAHRMGVVHRDIKPSNIMLTEAGDVKIGDFGIAQRSQSDTTQVLGMIGSPRYMSPEQAQEEDVGAQSDLFSLGVVMYELLTGHPPFNAQSFSRLIYTIIHEDPPPMRGYRSDLPPELDAVIARLLAKDLDVRYRTGAELAADLSRTFDYLGSLESSIDDEEKLATIKALDFFGSFSEHELWEVIRAGVWERWTTGDRIITEGNVEQSFYIIVKGDVIAKKQGKLLGMLEAGDCFGEMGYISQTRRSATILAVKDVITLKLHESLIDQASVGCQLKFLKVFLSTLVTRLTRTNEVLMTRQ